MFFLEFNGKLTKYKMRRPIYLRNGEKIAAVIRFIQNQRILLLEMSFYQDIKYKVMLLWWLNITINPKLDFRNYIDGYCDQWIWWLSIFHINEFLVL